MKIHVALNTAKMEESITFYRAFLDREPVKLKPGYAKFELEEPGLNLTLNAAPEGFVRGRDLNHLGIQVSSTEEVMKATRRLGDTGLKTLEEKDTDCCHSLQDKVWVQDPNGYQWEVFVVKGDSEAGPKDSPMGEEATKTCCEPTCCE